MTHKTTYEWEAIRYGKGDEEIPEYLAGRLAQVAKAFSRAGRGDGRILEYGRTALRARNYVGVVAARGCALEILPKIEKNGGSQQESQASIRQRLVHMLSVAHDLKLDVGQLTALAWQNETFLEVLIGLFAEKLKSALRRGRPRGYVSRAETLPYLRGRLDVARQFSESLLDPSRLACIYSELTADIALNQVIYAAVKHLFTLARSARNRQRLREIMFSYADVSLLPVAALRWDRVVLDRTSGRWREILDLARLLLGNKFQNTSAGHSDGFALVFDMARLFEMFVARSLRLASREDSLEVEIQKGLLFCAKDDFGQDYFQTKPDIVIRRGENVVQIIDTKWRRVSASLRDNNQRVSEKDVYQMLCYGRLYKCPRLTLLYPHHGQLGAAEGVFARLKITESDHKLEFAAIDVNDLHGIRQRLLKMTAAV